MDAAKAQYPLLRQFDSAFANRAKDGASNLCCCVARIKDRATRRVTEDQSRVAHLDAPLFDHP